MESQIKSKPLLLSPESVVYHESIKTQAAKIILVGYMESTGFIGPA